MSKFHCHCGETISGGTGQQERIAAHCAEHAKEEEVEEAIEEAVTECAAGPWIPVGDGSGLPLAGVQVLVWLDGEPRTAEVWRHATEDMAFWETRRGARFLCKETDLYTEIRGPK